MRKILIIVGLMVSVGVSGQAPVIQWQKNFGGSNLDFAYCIKQTFDGGYIFGGESSSSNSGNVSNSHGGGDYWIVKTTSTGVLQWQKSLGGSAEDQMQSIQQTIDSGYIIAGWTNSNNGDVTVNFGISDAWVVKLSKTGSLEWQKSYGGIGNDLASSIQLTNDGGYIVAGNSNSPSIIAPNRADDYWIMKLNSLGVLEWKKTLGGTKVEFARSIDITIDGGYIVAGTATSNNGDVTGNHGSGDFWVVKLSSTGVLQWQKSYGGSSSDEAYSIKQTTDKGYIIAGYTTSNDGDVAFNNGGEDYWIVKIDSLGVMQWNKSLGGTSDDNAYSVNQTIDGGYIVAGGAYSNDGDAIGNHGVQDYLVVKLDANGNIQWKKTFGSSTDDAAHSIQQTKDGGYVIVGQASSNDGDVSGNYGSWDYWVVKLAPDPLPLKLLSFTAQKENNNVLLHWQTTNELNVSHFNIQRSVNGKDFIDIGKVKASCCAYSFVDGQQSTVDRQLYYRLEIVNKDDSKTYSTIQQITIKPQTPNIVIYPNPAKEQVTITCKNAKIILVIDYLGRIVHQSILDSQPLTVNTKQLTKGIYVIKAIMNNGAIKTEKLVVE